MLPLPCARHIRSRAIEHQNEIVDYLTDLLEPFADDKRAAAAAILSVIDGAFSLRMLFGNSKVVPILAPAEAVLKSFQHAACLCKMRSNQGLSGRMTPPRNTTSR
jgi:hypothetical protein